MNYIQLHLQCTWRQPRQGDVKHVEPTFGGRIYPQKTVDNTNAYV